MGKLPVKGGVQQGVGDRSNHFLGAAFLQPGLGLNHGNGGGKEEGFAKPGQIGEKHFQGLPVVKPAIDCPADVACKGGDGHGKGSQVPLQVLCSSLINPDRRRPRSLMCQTSEGSCGAKELNWAKQGGGSEMISDKASGRCC